MPAGPEIASSLFTCVTEALLKGFLYLPFCVDKCVIYFYSHLNDSRNSKESGKMFLFEDDLVMVRFSIFVIFRDVFCVSRLTDF